jgi:hypothetical protein
MIIGARMTETLTYTQLGERLSVYLHRPHGRWHGGYVCHDKQRMTARR